MVMVHQTTLVVSLLIGLGAGVLVEEGRTKACTLLVAVDQTAWPELGGSDKEVLDRVEALIEELNKIYFTTVLAMPPFDNIYFRLSTVRKLDGFMRNCNNKNVVLEEFARAGHFCLAHLLTYRDFCCLKCIGGMASPSGFGTPKNALWEA